MLHIDPPGHSIADVYPACVARTRAGELRDALELETSRIFARAAEYQFAAATGTLSGLAQDDPIFVSRASLSGLYERVLVDDGERPTYLAIRSRSFRQRCPFCGQRDVQTLDHYLPKAPYPEFALLPENLIPCCFGCNHAKLDVVSGDPDQMLFHPYYDNWSNLPIFRAVIEITDGIDVTYHVNVEDLPADVAARALAHAEQLDLATLYANQAAVELVQKREVFMLTFESGGAEALRQELEREAESRRTPFPNSWQPVLYQALSLNEGFYEGGFVFIEETVPF